MTYADAYRASIDDPDCFAEILLPTLQEIQLNTGT